EMKRVLPLRSAMRCLGYLPPIMLSLRVKRSNLPQARRPLLREIASSRWALLAMTALVVLERLRGKLHERLGAGRDIGEERVGLGQHARHVEARGRHLALIEHRLVTGELGHARLGDARPEITHGDEAEGAQ